MEHFIEVATYRVTTLAKAASLRCIARFSSALQVVYVRKIKSSWW